jgi:hypothetical protein
MNQERAGIAIVTAWRATDEKRHWTLSLLSNGSDCLLDEVKKRWCVNKLGKFRKHVFVEWRKMISQLKYCSRKIEIVYSLPTSGKIIVRVDRGQVHENPVIGSIIVVIPYQWMRYSIERKYEREQFTREVTQMQIMQRIEGELIAYSWNVLKRTEV